MESMKCQSLDHCLFLPKNNIFKNCIFSCNQCVQFRPHSLVQCFYSNDSIKKTFAGESMGWGHFLCLSPDPWSPKVPPGDLKLKAKPALSRPNAMASVRHLLLCDLPFERTSFF